MAYKRPKPHHPKITGLLMFLLHWVDESAVTLLPFSEGVNPQGAE